MAEGTGGMMSSPAMFMQLTIPPLTATVATKQPALSRMLLTTSRTQTRRQSVDATTGTNFWGTRLAKSLYTSAVNDRAVS
eukprot:CAMPEP_0179142212 /NCGR_PEP_ID=MMETSP0796-20121207/68279_1 /TAXON_ID=73915 /ORGANISM="Pyrodinium bahamense, Strain pbaha01" /LENGTH=79 /DNA_ID=CAMNT_0020842047 /DNA_START=33 /DNA_END=269 /DNA_ORIENTATION=+